MRERQLDLFASDGDANQPNAQTGLFRKKRTPSTANAWDSRARCAVLLRSVYSATVKSSAKTVSFRWGSGRTHALVYAQKSMNLA